MLKELEISLKEEETEKDETKEEKIKDCEELIMKKLMEGDSWFSVEQITEMTTVCEDYYDVFLPKLREQNN